MNSARLFFTGHPHPLRLSVMMRAQILFDDVLH